MRWCPAVVVCGFAAALVTHAAAPPATDSHQSDEAVLRDASVPSDPAALLDRFRRLTPAADTGPRIDRFAADLGAASFRRRHRASRELQLIGLAAVPRLQQLYADPDPEVVGRAKECVQRIETDDQPHVHSAAVRLVARYRAAGSAETLLGYLPVAEETVAQEIVEALTGLADEPTARAALVAAIRSPIPAVRGAAGEALVRRDADPRAKPLLADRDPAARTRMAIAFAEAGERAAVPVLIASLADLPADSSHLAEATLVRLAGNAAPTVTISDDASRPAVREAWAAWWRDAGPSVDFSRLRNTVSDDMILVAVSGLRTEAGRIVEVGRDGKPRRQLEGMDYPACFEPLPRDRLLVAEWRANRVTEYDYSGKVLWRKEIERPIVCQRLPNGRTFIATQPGLIVEVDRAGKEQFTYRHPVTVMAAARRREGLIAIVDQQARCTVIDSGGRGVKVFPVGRAMGFTGIDALPGGRWLIPDAANGKVVEYDASGQPLRDFAAKRPVAVRRLANGQTLVVSFVEHYVNLHGRDGAVAWEYRPSDGQRPMCARVR